MKPARHFLALLFLVATVHSALAETHKLRIHDRAEAESLLAHGGRLIADYGGFQLIESDTPLPANVRDPRAEVDDDLDFIELHAGRLNTRAAQIKALRKTSGTFSGRRLHLVQFAGPVKSEWRHTLEKNGLRIVCYIPNNAYLVQGDAAALAQMQTWAGTNSIVQWEGSYADDYKILPGARTADAKGQPRDIGTDTFSIQLVDDASANAATLQIINQLKLAPIQRQGQTLGYLNLVVPLPAARLTEIAAQPDVVSIHPYFTPQKFCERQAQIIAGNLSGNVPSGPGYLAWLASKGFTQAQFDASGFVVDVSDSGIDNGTTSPNHFGLYTGGSNTLSSRVAYNRLEGTANSGSTLQGCDGHGNLNSHIIGGYDNLSGTPFADASGYHYGLGICPFVKVASSVIFDPSTFTSPNYPNLMSRAYRDGARVSNNSWGANTAGGYDSDAQSYDALVRDAQPTGSAVPNTGNQEITIVFASGNAGPNASTVGAPGTAKNVITVGAGENVQSFGGSDGSGIGDTQADSANDIVSFSSRGPCSDGRIKPDICAPGTHVSGGVAQAANPAPTGTAIACYDGKGVSGGVSSIYFPSAGQQFYTASSGTSHSTPGIAGACALLRQYFMNQSLTPPGPAMTKAYLMNSARYMSGLYANDTLPSNNQGMGEVNLGTAFDNASHVLRDEIAADKFTSTGQTRNFSGTINDPSKPFRITLAWTDAPGNTTGNAYNNDLDLTVTAGGNTYKGNVFSGAFSSTGGSADKKNNVENIFLPAGTTGAYTVTVTAANINSDGVPNNADPLDQDFALVIYNGTTTSQPIIASTSFTLIAEGCTPSNGAVDPGETVTMNLSLQNVGTAAASNLVVTLLATNGITLPSGPQTYGALATNGSIVTQPFTFTAAGTCGSSITAALQLQDGTNNLGTLTQTLNLGAPSLVFSQNFDGVSAPALPSGWTTSHGGGQSNWVTTNSLSDTLPNSAFSPDPSSTGSNILVSTSLTLSAGTAQLAFRHSYNLETGSSTTGYDGGVLEIKIGTNAFTDILTAGGSFVTGGYDHTISSSYSSPLAGRQAWSGNSGGFITTIVNLPTAARSQTVQFRWICGTDSSVSATGWYVDTITTSNTICCSGNSPAADLAIGQTSSPALVNLGNPVTFTLNVTNLGPNTATNVVVSNTLPAGLNFVSASPTASVTNGSTLTFNLGNLTNNAKSTITIQSTAVTAGSRTNLATVISLTSDPVSGNNSATAAVNVNSPPTISTITNVTTNENTFAGPIAFTITDAETAASLLALSGTSSNTNLLPNANIVFGGSASNRTVTLTPAANQFGASIITISVSDGLTNTSTAFTLAVSQVFHLPLVAPISNYTIYWLNLLTVPVSATSTDVPPQVLTFSLGTNAPAGAAIHPTSGVFTWTPIIAQAPTTNLINVIVANAGAPALTTTQSFTVTVVQSNMPPTLAAIPDQTIYALSTLTLTNSATDTNLPVQTLTFSLAINAPAGAEINPTNGIFTWTPAWTQLPATNLISVIVTDDGTPPLTATQSFTVTVVQSNMPPTLAAIPDQTVYALSTLNVTNSAADTNLPLQTLTFSLATNAPAGAEINPTNGIFTWTPDATYADTTNSIAVSVTDVGLPPLSDTKAFHVTVLLPPPFIQNVAVSTDVVTLIWSTLAGHNYRMQMKNNLADTNWMDVPGDLAATNSATIGTNTFDPTHPQFYRIMALP